VSALLRRDKSAGSGFARCAATARRAAGRTPAVAARHQIKQKAIRKDGLFALRQADARWRCAYRAYKVCCFCRPGKRSTARQYDLNE